MKYEKKIIFLLSLIGVLALLYAGSFIFTYERSNKRSSYYTWLDPKLTSDISKITVKTPDNELEFLKSGQKWFVVFNGYEYPAKDMRIEDFISFFTLRGAWPVRSNSASSHEGFGLQSGEADRVVFYGGSSALLDVFIGNDSAFGGEVAMRKAAQNEVRSGDNKIKTYVLSPVESWFDLKIFSEDDNVQKLTVFKDDGEEQVFSLSGRSWSVKNAVNPDNSAVENYIRIILSTEGDNFAGYVSDFENFSPSSRIIFEFGNGKIETVYFSASDESGRRLAYVQGRDYVYSVPAWASMRLFRDISSFETR